MTVGDLHPTAAALLEAHVAFLREQSRGTALRRLINAQVEGLLADVSALQFAELIDAERLRSVAVYSVQRLDLGPGLAELVGVIARHIYSDPIHAESTLADVVPDAAFEVFLDQLVELRALREAVIELLVSNAVFRDLSQELLLGGLLRYLDQTAQSWHLPSASSAVLLGRELLEKLRPNLGQALEQQLRDFVAGQARAHADSARQFLQLALDDAALRQILRDAWQYLENQPVAGFREVVSTDQVQDLAMLGTAFWKEFRQTDFMAALIEAGVDGFYSRHSQSSVQTILDELGVTSELLRTVCSQTLPGLLKQLDHAGVLDKILRRLLVDFYSSAQARAVLESAAAPSA